LRECDGSMLIIHDNLSHPRKSAIPADSFLATYSGLHLRVQADDDFDQYSSVFTNIHLCFKVSSYFSLNTQMQKFVGGPH
jgi:hypothetical protein